MKSEDVKIKEVIRERWNKSSQTYDSKPGHGIQSEHEKEAWESLLAKALGNGDGNEKLDVLDVGCGTGVITLLLAELGHNVTGLDMSEGMLEKAKEKANNFNLTVEFKLGDAEDPPFEDELFDVVINRHLLWTLPDPEKAISEWERVLKPGGRIVIIDGGWGGYKKLRRQIWRYLISMPLILITERRNPWKWRGRTGHYNMDIEKNFPMRHKKRPQADIEIIENLGFHVDVMDVTIHRSTTFRTQTFLGRLKYGHWGGRGYFLVKGIKKENQNDV